MERSKWKLDPVNSLVQFRVKHMMISNVGGVFTRFSGSMECDDEDFSTAKARFTIEVNSVSTHNEKRDESLKKGDFFLPDKYPTIEFVSTQMEKNGLSKFRLHGKLSIRGITKPVTFDAALGGLVKDKKGRTLAGFSVSGKINRKDFGLHFDEATEAAGIVVGDEVTVNCDVEFIKEEGEIERPAEEKPELKKVDQAKVREIEESGFFSG